MKFRGISRNYTTRNSAEFRRNCSQFRTEYGIDGSKKKQTEFRVGGIPWTPYSRVAKTGRNVNKSRDASNSRENEKNAGTLAKAGT